mgnify:CR=1 FL=1
MPDSDVFSERPSASGTDGNSLRETGRISFARWTPSPNFGPRPDGAGISLLVVHNISLPPGQFGGREIEDFFCNQLDHSAHPYFKTIEGVQVSAHLLIRRDGALVQFVSLLDRAWHAGRSCFEGQEECNDFSIGIELEGTDDTPYTTEQYRMLAKVADYQQQELERIVTTLVRLFEPLMLLVMAAVVLVIVMAILLPILNMNTLVM